ncbi:MAG: YeeE/YedE family protein [Pseudomonadales bacterium]|nr:YeeE/YedE family protein [Pseudomonadales bacterium]
MIDYAQFTPLSALLGGALIGCSAFLLLYLNGRISGISGIASRLLEKPKQSTTASWLFVAGLITGSAVASSAFSLPVPKIDNSWPLIIASGLLVGFGSVYGSGCTSGHGVCGLARLSRRSLVSVPIFMLAAVLSYYLLSQVS